MNHLELNEYDADAVITGNPWDLVEADVPIKVTWDHLSDHLETLPAFLKAAISPVNAPELPSTERVRMLWLCYRDSEEFASDFAPDDFVANEPSN